VTAYLTKNERDYKRDPSYISFALGSETEKIEHSFEIPEGEYVISIFQDENNNGRRDLNFLGMSTEPVGLSNHSRGIPGGFNKLKIQINDNSNRTSISVRKP